MKAYREQAGVDWVQFESPHSIDEIRAARAAIDGPFSFMRGKLGAISTSTSISRWASTSLGIPASAMP